MRISDWSSDVCSSDLWPTRQELMAHYAAGTGRSMDSFDYYLILAMFKGGCILEYKVAQAAKGILSAETGRFFDRLVRGNFAEAEKLIRLVEIGRAHV